MNKTILITGANSGFGKAIALNLSKHGFNLILTGRSLEKLQPVMNEIKTIFPSKIHPLVFDVRDFESVKQAIESLPAELQQIDILINNAGLALELNTIDQGNLDDWNTMIDTNVKGILYVTKLVSPQMVVRKKGHIINIGSISSHEIYKGGSVYCASKHAVLALSQGMRTDFLEHNIRVTQISPGAAETNFSITRFHGDEARATKVYEGFTPLSANDVADVVEFVVTRPAHVCLNEIIMTPTAQFNGTIVRNL
jgi:NADP-dependent 3-hydroxy acid dehydrogenase YdfG